VKGKYYSPKHEKEVEVEIVKESKRYFWVSLFNSIQRKKKHLITKEKTNGNI